MASNFLCEAPVFMRLFRSILFERTHLRRAISIATAVLYSFLMFGVPLPAAVRKQGDAAYPCQDTPCGCATAEQCWTKCCCTTAEQRFAWAARNGVTPPDFATPPSGDEQESPTKECCVVKKPCCESETPGSKRGFTFVLGIAAQKCQGLTAMGAAAGLLALSMPWVTWQPHFEPLGWIDAPAEVAQSESSLPLLPPPRT
jgi:hypothetical protein